MKQGKINSSCEKCSKDCWARGHNQFRGTIVCNDFIPKRKAISKRLKETNE